MPRLDARSSPSAYVLHPQPGVSEPPELTYHSARQDRVSDAEAWGRIEVLSGSVSPDLTWVVTAGGRAAEFATMLSISRAGIEIDEGGGRGTLPDGWMLSPYEVHHADIPCFVMALTIPEVGRVIATTDQGTDVVLTLSPTFPQFALRFAVAALPIGERPGTLRVEVAGKVAQTWPDDMRQMRRRA